MFFYQSIPSIYDKLTYMLLTCIINVHRQIYHTGMLYVYIYAKCMQCLLKIEHFECGKGEPFTPLPFNCKTAILPQLKDIYIFVLYVGEHSFISFCLHENITENWSNQKAR